MIKLFLRFPLRFFLIKPSSIIFHYGCFLSHSFVKLFFSFYYYYFSCRLNKLFLRGILMIMCNIWERIIVKKVNGYVMKGFFLPVFSRLREWCVCVWRKCNLWWCVQLRRALIFIHLTDIKFVVWSRNKPLFMLVLAVCSR